MNADPEVMRYFPAPLSREESRLFMEHLEAQASAGMTFWPMEIPGEAPFVGVAGLEPVNFEAHFAPCVEVGWRLASGFWGKGYATEAGRAALHFGFKELGLSEIVSFTAAVNQRSIRVMQRLGMTGEGNFEHPKLAPGHPLRNHVLYRIRRP